MTENDLQNGNSLLARLLTHVPGGAELSPKDVFYHWFHAAMTEYQISRDASAFVPCRTAFASQSSFRVAFGAFVDEEIRPDKSIGFATALPLITRTLRQILWSSVRDDLKLYASTEYDDALDHFVFELFSVLLDLDSEQATEWAVEAIGAGSEFARMKGPGGDPAPLDLHYLIFDDAVASQSRTDYLVALMYWCDRFRYEVNTAPTARFMLPRALLATQSDGSPMRQLALIETLLRTEVPGRDLMSLIELEIDAEEFRRGKEVMNGISSRMRSALHPMLFELVRGFDSERKRSWQRSFLLGSALQAELVEMPTSEETEHEAPTLPFIDQFADSMGAIFGLSAEDISNSDSRSQMFG